MCKLRNCSHHGLAVAGQSVPTGSQYRLPRDIWPLHYELELTPDFEHLTFWGNVAIDVDVRNPAGTSSITLNANHLTIGKASVEDANGTVLTGTVSLDSVLQRVTVSFNGNLGAGKWKLKLAFAGELNDELKGFYRSTWTDDQGKVHVIATTQFEATDARRAFPCFDEPEMKATFKVALNVPHDYTALSAMKVESTSTMSVSAPAELVASVATSSAR
jgi:puromycin-sensitive aminopeptidase